MQQAKKSLVLASTSPRRLSLLQSLGFQVTTIAPDVDESQLPGESPKEMVMRLAKMKANAITAPQHLPIIAADTIVCVGDLVLGKPKDKNDAFRILSLMSGKAHQVMTGYVVKMAAEEILGCEITQVTFRALSKDEILAYINNSNEAFDKSGAYGIQGAAASFIHHITGSFTSVMGLPLPEILEALDQINNKMSVKSL